MTAEPQGPTAPPPPAYLGRERRVVATEMIAAVVSAIVGAVVGGVPGQLAAAGLSDCSPWS